MMNRTIPEQEYESGIDNEKNPANIFKVLKSNERYAIDQLIQDTDVTLGMVDPDDGR